MDLCCNEKYLLISLTMTKKDITFHWLGKKTVRAKQGGMSYKIKCKHQVAKSNIKFKPKHSGQKTHACLFFENENSLEKQHLNLATKHFLG